MGEWEEAEEVVGVGVEEGEERMRWSKYAEVEEEV